MSKNVKIKANDVLNYDGMAKQSLDVMKDENLIKFINRIFDRNLSLDSVVKRLATETYDENINQNRCDYYVCIDKEMFLIEIQSYDDAGMAMRLFNYGIRGAKLHGQDHKEGELIELHLPKPVVFFLRKSSNPIEELSVRLISLENETFDYTAKAVYLDDYSFKDMIDGYMYPMMPFYPLRYEKILLKRHTEDDEKKIFDDLINNAKMLREPLEKGIISKEDCRYICEWMSNTFRVVVNKSKKRKKLINKKEAERVMQYIVDEPIEGFNIYKALRETKNDAYLNNIRSLIRNMNLTVKDAMDVLEIPEEARKELTEILEAENKTAES